MKLLNIKQKKFFLMVIILFVIVLLDLEHTLVRRILYTVAGVVLSAKTRTEKVTMMEYASLIGLVYIVISLVFPSIMPVKSFVYKILKLGGLYGILHFIMGELLGYIFIPRD